MADARSKKTQRVADAAVSEPRVPASTTSLSALREQAAGLRRAQSMAKLAHVITKPDGSFESWSETLPHLVGVRPDEVVESTRKWLDVVHVEDRALFRQTALKAMREGTRADVEYRLQRQDGSLIHVRQVMEPIPGHTDAQGRARWFNTLQDITEQKLAEEALRASESLKTAILESAMDAFITIDGQGNIVDFNPAAERIFGVTRDAALGQSMIQLVFPPQERDLYARRLPPSEFSGSGALLGRRVEIQATRQDGTTFPAELSITSTNAGGRPLFTACVRDITRQKAAEDSARRLNRVYAVLSGINTLIVRAKDRGEIYRESCRIAVEQGGFRMALLGMVDVEADAIKPAASHGDLGDVLRRAPLGPGGKRTSMAWRAVQEKRAVISHDIEAAAWTGMKKAYEESGIRCFAFLPLVIDGQGVGVLALYAAEIGFFNEEEMKLLNELAGDISFALSNIQKAERLDYLAFYDALTGLANRTLFLERLRQHLQVAERDKRQLALIIVDLERFRTINDSFGRHAGDALLKEFAGRMVKAAGDPTRLARLVGDQFAVVADFRGEGDIARITEHARKRVLGEPFKIEGTELRMATTAGIALFPNDGADADKLLTKAEAALRKAKATGERDLFYTDAMSERVAEKLTLENKLRQALLNREFVLHYQPKVAVETRDIVGVEALLRWNSPELGLVPPLKFISLLEETGLILEVGSWALKQASLDQRRWVEQGLKPLRVAVNVSAIQLRKRSFVNLVEEAVIDGSAPTGIDVEITESLVMDDIDSNIEKLKALRRLGINIAIDDFGTGYSSLAYLAKLPVQALKIDRSFIKALNDDPNAMTLVSTIISLAHSLRLAVVAEGVETEDQARILRLLRCDQMQGYLVSKPLPADQLIALLPKS